MIELTTKEIYQNSCEKIASHLEVYDFKYFKSGQKIKKVLGDLTYEIAFGSSVYNSKGSNVKIKAHVWVKSKKLKKWRLAQNRPKATDVIAHSDIRYIPKPWIIGEWNLASPTEREDVINEIISVITKTILPYLAKFQDPKTIFNHIIQNQDRSFGNSLYPRIDYAFCFLSEEEAKEIVKEYIRIIFKNCDDKNDSLKGFSRAYETYQEMEIEEDHLPTALFDVVAFYCVKYKWGNLASDVA